ncbi:MAG: hypothetical protein H6980_09520 [Gammaproteobacteria bacterium]|nr:hypothetical protein [Gammaproteobacteria bacterium]
MTSATYNASTGALVVTGQNLLKRDGATNDIDASTLTLTGEGGVTYTLTDTADVEITDGGSFTLTLSATDKAAVNQLLNKDGTVSTGGTTFNLAAAEDWNIGADSAVNIADLTGNGVTVSNVAAPTVTSATYNASTGALVVTGQNLLKRDGATNDIDASTLTLTGEGGVTYTLTDTADVEITDGGSFTLTLSATDKAAVNQLLNKDGTVSTGGTTFNLAAAEDWNIGADATVNIADLTGNGVTVSNVAAPTVTSATYNASTGALVVTGQNLLKRDGVTNDIDASTLTLTGEGGVTYTLTDTADVEITDGGSFTLTLSATDKAAVNQLLNKDGTVSTGGTTFNLAAAEDWNIGADATVNIADLTGNGVTVSNVAAPTVTSATYNSGTGTLVVTGQNLLKRDGATNDIDASKLTLTGEGGATYTLTDTSDVEITSGTSFTLTLSATDKAAVNNLLNKAGTSSNDSTVYNVAAAEDWNLGADSAVNIADLTTNAITVTIVSAPTVAVSENSGGGINASEASNGTPVVVGLAGTNAAAGDTVTVNWGGQQVSYVLQQSDINGGSATVTVPTGTITTQGNGTFNVTARITYPGNDQGALSNATSVTVDTTPPTAPSVTSVVASSSTPTVNGTVSLGVGETLQVVVNGVTYTEGDGNLVRTGSNWTLGIPLVNALGDGTYSVTATVTDLAGNATSDTTSSELVVDTTPPANPTITQVLGGGTTVTGTAEAGATVRVTLPGGAGTRDVVAGGNGTWTLTGVGPFTVGQTVLARAIDAAGNESSDASSVAANTSPSLGANNGWNGTQGATGTISATQLSVSDAESSSANIVFTVTDAPDNGTLKVGGVALGVGGTFTQADIDSGRLAYTHSGNGTTVDSFRFTVSDGGGGTLSETNFALNIQAATVTAADPTPTAPAPKPVQKPVAPSVTAPSSDTGSQSLFNTSIGGGTRSAALLGGVGTAAGDRALGGGDGIRGGQPQANPETGDGNVDGAGGAPGGLGGISPAAGGGNRGAVGPVDGQGDVSRDIQRFANAPAPDATLGVGEFGDIGSELNLGDGDGGGDQGNGANDGLSDLNGDTGNRVLFAQNQNGAFGVRAGDFFRIFTDTPAEGGGDEGPFGDDIGGDAPQRGQGPLGQGGEFGPGGANAPGGQFGNRPAGPGADTPFGDQNPFGSDDQLFVLPVGGGENQPPANQEGGEPQGDEGNQPGPRGDNGGGVQA